MIQKIITTKPSKKQVEELAKTLGKARKIKDSEHATCQYLCLCPAHEDKEPSLCIGVSKQNGKLLLNCFAGCKVSEIKKALQKRGIKIINNRDIQLPIGIRKQIRENKETYYYVQHWTYHNEKGEILGYVVRYENFRGEKTIRPYFINNGKGWKSGINLEKRPIYNLHKLKDKEIVVVTEGEKAADAIEELFDNDIVIGTTSIGGANSAAKTDWTPLKDKAVLIWPDSDDPGLKYAKEVYEILKKVGNEEVAIVDYTQPPLSFEHGKGEDAYDYLQKYGKGALKNKKLQIFRDANFLKELENGIILDFINKQTKQIKKEETVIITNCVIYPSRVIEHLETQEVLGFEVTKETKKRKIKKVLTNHSASNYVKHFAISEKTARIVADIVAEEFNKEKEIETIKAFDKIKWLNNEKFLHPALFEEAVWFPDLLMNSNDDKPVWLPLAKVSRKKAIEALRELLLLCSGYYAIIPILFALFTLHDKENGLCLEITGKSAKGKSIILSNAAHLIGANVLSWDMSDRSLVETLGYFQNYPIFVDEIHLAKEEKTVATIIYSLLQQQTRRRLNKDGTLKPVRTFSTNLLTSGEFGVSTVIENLRGVRAEGIIKRTINITAQTQTELLGAEGDEIKNTMRELRETAQGWLLKVWTEENKKDSFIFYRTGDAHYARAFQAMQAINERLFEMKLIDKRAKDLNREAILYCKEQQQKFEQNVYDSEDYHELILSKLIEIEADLKDFEDTSKTLRGKCLGWIREEEDGRRTYYLLKRTFINICKELKLNIDIIKKQKWIRETPRKVWIPAAQNSFKVFIISPQSQQS